MAIFSVRAASHSVYRMFSLFYCKFSYFPFGFEGGTLVLIASVTDHCLSFTFRLAPSFFYFNVFMALKGT